MKTTLQQLLAFVACAAVAFASAQANPWPTKPVRIRLGASAGDGTDIVARMLAEKYQGIFGQPFVIENRPEAMPDIQKKFPGLGGEPGTLTAPDGAMNAPTSSASAGS